MVLGDARNVKGFLVAPTNLYTIQLNGLPAVAEEQVQVLIRWLIVVTCLYSNVVVQDSRVFNFDVGPWPGPIIGFCKKKGDHLFNCPCFTSSVSTNCNGGQRRLNVTAISSNNIHRVAPQIPSK